MKRFFIRPFSIVLVAIVSMSLVAGEVCAKETNNSSKQELEEAIKEKEKLESALADAEALVTKLKGSKDSTESKIRELDGQLSGMERKIKSLEEQLGDLNSQIDESAEALQQAEEEGQKQYEAMRTRIQFMYENKNSSVTSLLLGADSFSSFLNAVEYMSMISKYDKDMMEAYEATIALQKELKEELEDKYASVKNTEDSIGVQKQTVQVLKTAKSQELGEITEDYMEAQELAEVYEKEVEAQNEILQQIIARIREEEANGTDEGDDTYLNGGTFAWPAPDFTRISSDFGPRQSPTAGASTDHKGVDMAAPYESRILAAESGKVITAQYSNSAGNYIIIDHGKNADGKIVCTVYMHCSSLLVSKGDIVTRGQQIGKVGSTGYSTGNHLHFGVTVGGTYVSPWNYIPKP